MRSRSNTTFPGPATTEPPEEFRKRIALYLEEHQAAKPGAPVSLLFFMQAWMKEHLSRTAKLYSAFLNARGVRGQTLAHPTDSSLAGSWQAWSPGTACGLPDSPTLRYSFRHVRELHCHRPLDEEASALRL